jgi:hypothetical protein
MPIQQGHSVVAYAVHVDGSLWDDPDISAWCESVRDAATLMETAEAFFAGDDNGVPLLTIVRAQFTREEWTQIVATGWALS